MFQTLHTRAILETRTLLRSSSTAFSVKNKNTLSSSLFSEYLLTSTMTIEIMVGSEIETFHMLRYSRQYLFREDVCKYLFELTLFVGGFCRPTFEPGKFGFSLDGVRPMSLEHHFCSQEV